MKGGRGERRLRTMFADLGHCSNCGRDLRFVASNPDEGLCHPCWRVAHGLIDASQSDDEFYNDRQTLIAGVYVSVGLAEQERLDHR